ncbi:MAG: FAD-binding oxidoreductase [Candidatus Rokuibacteriota bacterium]|nr:MAG: FAD-binding oxidoreductase [Candidatus Rokubacteria bacterium]
MAVSVRSLEKAFASLVGRERVVDDPVKLGGATIDGCVPRFIVRPAAVDELSGIVALACEERLAVIPRGSGSALELGAPPSRLDVVIDLRDLDRVLEYNPDDLTASVEAGVTLGALAKLLSDRRQFAALDPPGGTSRSLGGITATNAVGPLACRYGAMRDRLLGVRFVQADGVVTWGGAKVVKSVTGYDIPKLMVGALGTLGVLAELTLRLHPMPEHEASWLASCDTLDAAGTLVAAILESTLQPNRVEIVSRGALEALRLGAAVAAVAVSIASVEPAVAAQEESLRSLVRANGGTLNPASPGWWDRYGDVVMSSRVTIRIGTLPSEVARTVGAVERLLGPAVAVVGSAATGTLHALLSECQVQAMASAVGELRAMLAPFGGHATITRGPRALREAIDPWGPTDPGALALMRGLKDEFDPHRVLNPGRFVGGL